MARRLGRPELIAGGHGTLPGSRGYGSPGTGTRTSYTACNVVT